MVIYYTIIGLLAGMTGLHFLFYKKLSNEKSQLYILGVCVCYGLIIILKRLEFGKIIGTFYAQMLTFPLTTATFFLIAGYVSVLFDSRKYRKISHFFYGAIIIIMIAGMLMYMIKHSIDLYYYGLTFLSVQYVFVSVENFIKRKEEFDKDTVVLLIAVYIMIISFAALALLTVLEIKWAYLCSAGIFIYLITAEVVSISQVVRRLQQLENTLKESESLTSTEEEIYHLMKDEERETKAIAEKLNLAVETVRKYQKNIYRKKGVHSKKELCDS